MALANTLRQHRFHHGEMTQKRLAELIGVSRQTVNAFEGNKYPPTLEVAIQTAGISNEPASLPEAKRCSDAAF